MIRHERTLTLREPGLHEAVTWVDPVVTPTDRNRAIELVAKRLWDEERLTDLAMLSDQPGRFVYDIASAADYFAGKRQMAEQGVQGRAVIVSPAKTWMPKDFFADQEPQASIWTNVVVPPDQLQATVNELVGTPDADRTYFGFNRYGFISEDGGAEPMFHALRFGTLEEYGSQVRVVDVSLSGQDSLFVAAQGLEMTPLSTVVNTGLPAVRFG